MRTGASLQNKASRRAGGMRPGDGGRGSCAKRTQFFDCGLNTACAELAVRNEPGPAVPSGTGRRDRTTVQNKPISPGANRDGWLQTHFPADECQLLEVRREEVGRGCYPDQVEGGSRGTQTREKRVWEPGNADGVHKPGGRGASVRNEATPAGPGTGPRGVGRGANRAKRATSGSGRLDRGAVVQTAPIRRRRVGNTGAWTRGNQQNDELEEVSSFK
jgi:hypothetical protein